MVFVLAFATAFGDEMPVMKESREIGALLNSEAPGRVVIVQPKRFRGDLLYTPEDLLPVREISGAAAGGIAREDETSRTWDHLMGPPGGSELP